MRVENSYEHAEYKDLNPITLIFVWVSFYIIAMIFFR